ncbi:hypothetical protein ICV35_22545 [Rhodococcus ruber]|uniref:hypothetical protein n=1 Tax=Rhodococcus ruber TaxID=1830 RepID=UPI00177C10D6|nr:hypothetical protein [Rhodococcus ruber]MBD8056435.1 hypothetical protein [Rhodococcus ruber]
MPHPASAQRTRPLHEGQEIAMPTIADVAHQLADRLDIEYDAAVTLATTYAAQLGCDTFEGGQDPDLEITDADAEHILSAAEAGEETTVESILDDIAHAARAIDTAIDDRNDLIRKAIREGVSRTKIAEAAGLSRERIYQIRDGRN